MQPIFYTQEPSLKAVSCDSNVKTIKQKQWCKQCKGFIFPCKTSWEFDSLRTVWQHSATRSNQRLNFQPYPLPAQVYFFCMLPHAHHGNTGPLYQIWSQCSTQKRGRAKAENSVVFKKLLRSFFQELLQTSCHPELCPDYIKMKEKTFFFSWTYCYPIKQEVS